jgi:Fe2+ or Zn2+ uptake regulation protein
MRCLTVTPRQLPSITEGKSMVRKIDKSTGEITTITPGGLYAPLPIPAYQVLAECKQFTAQRVLIALISHLGDNGWLVYPSYTRISKMSGVARSSIRRALDVLEDYGFIKVTRIQTSQTQRTNRYYIQLSCYHTSQMNKFAREHLDKRNLCFGCGNRVSPGDHKDGPSGPIHLGCGGKVRKQMKQIA